MKRLTTANVIEWYYDFKGDQYGFLVLNSDNQNLIQDLRRELASAGINCLKQGKCFKAASNNKQYQVYLTVTKLTGGRPSLVELKSTIRRSFPNLHYDASPTEIREYFNFLQDTVEDRDKVIIAKDERIESLKQTLSSYEETIRSQREQFDTERQALLQKLSDDESLNKMIEEEYARHKATEAALEEHHKSEIDNLTKHYDNLNSWLRRAEAERDRVLDDLVKAREENRSLREPDGKNRSGMTEDELSETLSVLLPNLSLNADSIRFVLDEVANRKPLFRHLRQLNDRESLPFKRFESADGWMEVDKHISDGRSPRVRIYYKKDRRSGKCLVYVSDKDYQKLTARALNELG